MHLVNVYTAISSTKNGSFQAQQRQRGQIALFLYNINLQAAVFEAYRAILSYARKIGCGIFLLQLRNSSAGL